MILPKNLSLPKVWCHLRNILILHINATGNVYMATIIHNTYVHYLPQDQSSPDNSFTLPAVWEQVQRTAGVVARKQEITQFNKVVFNVLGKLYYL